MGKVVLLFVIVASERASEHSVLFHDQRSSCPFVAQKNNRRVLEVFTSMVDPAYLTYLVLYFLHTLVLVRSNVSPVVPLPRDIEDPVQRAVESQVPPKVRYCRLPSSRSWMVERIIAVFRKKALMMRLAGLGFPLVDEVSSELTLASLMLGGESEAVKHVLPSFRGPEFVCCFRKVRDLGSLCSGA